MCGIVALLQHEAPREEVLMAMVETLTHRGPDDSGVLVVPEHSVALGMRRLSVVDIEGGRQPMWSDDRSAVVVFNGEVYNAPELRAELSSRGRHFVTDHSDTEVLANGYAEWGPDLFSRLNGMFAVAIWDQQAHRLVVARDIAGEKPLYIAKLPNGYAIASEIKALLAHPGVDRDVDLYAIAEYLSFDYVFAPRTPFKAVSKLPAAHYAEISASRVDVSRYWSPPFAESQRGGADLDELDHLLSDSVRRRMVADVPIGLFLSGGLDSTTVGYYMRLHSAHVHSFSIAFEESAYDESAFQTMAADALEITHHVEVLSGSRAADLVEYELPRLLDEPIADDSLIPTLLLSNFATRSVKVALGGDGSDELLMGYRTYKLLKVLWNLDRLGPITSAAGRLAKILPMSIGTRRLRSVEFARLARHRPTQRVAVALGAFAGEGARMLAPELRSSLESHALDAAERAVAAETSSSSTAAEAAVAAYFRGYLQEDILVKVDRASMAASLEVRAPFLDPRVIDYVLRLPYSDRLRGLTGKHVLRRLMRGRIPDAIIDRRKSGFAAPVDRWLRGRLGHLVRELLEPLSRGSGTLYDPAMIARLLRQHAAGKDVGKKVWALLVLELWRTTWTSG